MGKRYTWIALLAALVLAIAAPALAHHKSWHKHGKGMDNAADGNRGADAGSNGNKAEKSDDGEKPFDEEPNDHPSGKDRSEEPGGSGTQGNSPSDPDGDANGGADKPGGDGGFDSDKDGNNGCGNDDDFEDDNNGWCGKPEEADVKAKKDKKVDDEVLGEVFRKDTAPPADVVRAGVVRQSETVAAAPVSIEKRSASVLPFTGPAAVAFYVALGLGLLSLGTLTLAVATRRK